MSEQNPREAVLPPGSNPVTGQKPVTDTPGSVVPLGYARAKRAAESLGMILAWPFPAVRKRLNRPPLAPLAYAAAKESGAVHHEDARFRLMRVRLAEIGVPPHPGLAMRLCASQDPTEGLGARRLACGLAAPGDANWHFVERAGEAFLPPGVRDTGEMRAQWLWEQWAHAVMRTLPRSLAWESARELAVLGIGLVGLGVADTRGPEGQNRQPRATIIEAVWATSPWPRPAYLEEQARSAA